MKSDLGLVNDQYDGNHIPGLAGRLRELIDELESMFSKITQTSQLSAALSDIGAVIGPASSTDGGFAKFDGTTGQLLKDSAAVVAVTDGGTGVTTSTGTGSVVLSTSPTLVTPALGTPASGVVTNLTGTASININGTVGATTPAAGSFTTLSATGNTTLGDASGDTLTINAGTWTYGSNWSASRAVGAAAAGISNALTLSASLSGDAGGTSAVRVNRENVTLQGTNTIAEVNGRFLHVAGSAATPVTLVEGYDFFYSMTGGSTATTVSAYVVRAPTLTGGSTITTYNGYRCVNPASASITTVRGIMIEDITLATTMRGIQSSVSSGTGKHNLYIDGSAQNYLAGELGVGIAASSTTQLATAASTTSKSSLRLPHGAAPTSPVDGDMWTTTAGLFVQINGSTIGPLS